MTGDCVPVTPADGLALDLIGRHQLILERGPDQDMLQLLGADGNVKLSLCITPAGPVLRFEGGGLTIQSVGALAIDAEHVTIRGRKGVVISSDGDARICVEGDLSTRARAQDISAELGDINIHANDDVKLDGERIRMNC
jgi:hypothetical protein